MGTEKGGVATIGVAAALARDEELRTTLAACARRLTNARMDSPDSEAVLAAIVGAALEAMPHVAAASVTMVDSAGAVTTRAPSDDVVAEVDACQAELREGPCIDASRDAGSGITDVADLADPDPDRAPWPRLAPRALAAGYACVLSFQLVVQGAVGALNLWGTTPGGFTEQDRLLGALFTDQAAVALAGARRADQLNRALTTRDVIGRAKGILMERFRVGDAEAFAMLAETSQNTNLKLAEVAAWLAGDAEVAYARDGAGAEREAVRADRQSAGAYSSHAGIGPPRRLAARRSRYHRQPASTSWRR